MKRLTLFIAVLMIVTSALTGEKTRAQVETGGLCQDYSSTFSDQWTIEVGEAVSGVRGSFARSQIRSSNKDQVARASIYNPVGGSDSRISDFWIRATPEDATSPYYPNLTPYHLQIKLYLNNNVVFDVSYSLDPDSSGGAFRHIAIPDVVADRIWFDIYQPTNSPGNASVPVLVQVERVCAKSSLPTPTYTPSPTFPPPTAAPGPSDTPYPTITPLPPTPTRTLTRTRTPTITRTPTGTRTPVPTNTPTDTFTPGGPTLTPSNTLGGATDTPPPSETPEPPQPTETYASTLADYLPLTPIPPDDECTDINNPCRPFPQNTLQPPSFYTPTLIALLPSLTPIASVTIYTLQTAYPSQRGTPVLPIQLQPVIEQVNDTIDSLQNLQDSDQLTQARNTLYQSGQSINWLWSIVTSITNSDLGPEAYLLVFLIALLTLNILLRVFFFVLKVVIVLLKLFPQATGIIVVIILIFAIAAIFNLFNLAGESTATPAPTVTLGTPTVTVTLDATGPTPTSKYKGLRPTGTPWPTFQGTSALQIDMESKVGEVADTAINAYKFANQNNAMDVLSFIMLAVAVFGVAVSLQRQLTRDKM
ncbi:MAG: hypothetical protein KF716_14955 [Anaerolineae bacterium]|nr:hypothetical protein [Anaerolineae bacterium]